MPTIIKEFDWKQTDTHLKIDIPLKAVIKSKLNTFISSRYIKVSYEQKFLDVILLFPVDEKYSKCIIGPENVILELKKCQNAIYWETLEPVLSKTQRLELKKDLLEKSYQQIQKQSETENNLRAELKRTAIRKQIETDTKVRESIEKIKQHEKSVALGDTKDWTENVKIKLVGYNGGVSDHSTQNSRKSEQNRSKLLKEPNNILPRQLKTVQVNFTPRQFPTPSRESKLEEEREWLNKQAAARRSCGFVSEDIRPEERNPQFLKAKGEEFLKNRNYLGAISIFSYGIQISPTFVDFYISRAKAHFELGERHYIYSV